MADFLANDAYHFTPCSSPPSSPVSWDDHSLKASDSEDEITGSPWKLTSDPYSANAKATQSPVIHDPDVRRTRRPCPIPLTPSSSFASYAPLSPSPAPRTKVETPQLIQAKHTPIQDPPWEEAINDVFSNGTSIINLDNSNIICIPRAIADLNNMIPLPAEQEPHSIPSALPETPARSDIASAAARSRRVFSQSRSNNTLFSGGSPVGKERGKRERELQIYLANNNLTVLPTELFALKGLTLLSLRANKLRELPPAISNIKSLRSLNIANNELTYLPAELTHLKLQTLLVDPNPFLTPPAPTPNQTHSNSRVLGPLKVHSHIPKLSELALRVILEPEPELEQSPKSRTLSSTPTKPVSARTATLPTPSPSHTSVFSSLSASTPAYRFPPHTLAISSHFNIQSWLLDLPATAATRIQAASNGSDDAREVYGICPSSRHRTDSTQGLFVNSAEERFEWVSFLAGCELASPIPILWRGCSAGCPGFLEEQEEGGRTKERDEDEEFMEMFSAGVDEEKRDEAAVKQIVWDDTMDLDD